jgi:uroporphyrin-III C-methyltransferase/precorrin-2 dehydrogenase/sirohydrochlorin ferrochelatase
VVSPELSSSLARQTEQGSVSHRAGSFEASDLDGVNLVIAATDDAEVNRQVSELAKARQLPVNVVDNPELCSFIVPSIIDRSPVQIAVSTGGASPVLARALRTRLESVIPSTYGRLASAELEKAVSAGGEQKVGEVYLIGGGPGDPDLLTFRALRLMQKADVVVHDRLISKEVLELTRRDAERIYVGKERDNHAVPQEEINQLLADLAKQGKRVCRLKGGDPFVFGRGGEEIETLTENGVNFQVVPAITAALGASAYAGIPLTHRDYSQAAVFVTGHLKDGSMNLNWPALAQPNQTVVFYMGLKGLPVICSQLMEHGLPSETPIALVQQATTPRQRVFTGTIGDMPERIANEQVKAPTLIIVGNVVKLHDKLNWFRSQAMIEKGEY